MDSRKLTTRGGSRYISEEGRPDRAALPMHCIDGACTARELDILWRFTEASEYAKGNVAVGIGPDEQPRGRYADYADKIDFPTYRAAEADAYRWICAVALGEQAAFLTEVIARLNAGRMNNGFDFVEFGSKLINELNEDRALGAAIGGTRVICLMLQDAYRDYAEHYAAMMAAASAGRVLTQSEQQRRIRRGVVARTTIAAYRPKLDEAI